eukprot:6576678-Alexandrium_andersonii.AAC.1
MLARRQRPCSRGHQRPRARRRRLQAPVAQRTTGAQAATRAILKLSKALSGPLRGHAAMMCLTLPPRLAPPAPG